MTRIRARTRKEQDVYAGRMVRIFRRLAGLSRDDMAKKLDLSVSSYTCWEYGKHSWDIPDVVKICDMFEVNATAFVKQMTFDISGITVQYIRGDNYDARKQRAQAMAVELAPYGCVPKFQAELKRLGKRYGLIRELRARGVLK